MKPISLTFSGIGGYEDEFFVDFEALAVGGIFGIFGATGSGKSTILDAMTLALYGTSAVSRYKGTVGTHFLNVNVDVAYSSLVFELCGERYTASRSFKREKERARVTKCRLTDSADNILADRKSDEVTKAVEGLLGLNYNDFTRTILLPQGKFSEFLFLKGDERSKMMERLFGLEEFGKKLQTRIKEFAGQVHGEILHISGRIEVLGVLSQSQLLEMEKALGGVVVEIAALTKQKESFFKEWEKYKVYSQNLNQLNGLLGENGKLEDFGKKLQGHMDALELAKKAEPLRQPMERLGVLESALGQARKNLGTSSKLLAAVNENAKICAKEYLQARKIADEELPVLTAIVRLENERAGLRAEYGELKAKLRDAWDSQAHWARELAKGLESGKPCPVCGSLEHPNAPGDSPKERGTVPYQLADEGEIRGAMGLIEEQGRRKAAEIGRLRGERAGLSEDIKELEVHIANISINARKTQDLKEKYDGEYQEAAKNHALAKEREEQLSKEFGELSILVDELLAQGGFDSPAATSSAFMPPEQVRALESEIASFHQKRTGVADGIKRLEAELAEIDKEAVPAGLETAQKHHERAEAALTLKHKEAAVLTSQIEHGRNNLKTLETLLEKHDALKARHGLILEIDGLFRGGAFIKYIARRHLTSITRDATTRLKSMSAGQYAIEFDSDTNFLIRDDKNAGKHRPASSLSGGEAFMASLCLALALANKIQARNSAGLSFFFLDEGFGSLDAASLDTVVTTLESLASENMSVGLISHVEELKHRILNRLELK